MGESSDEEEEKQESSRVIALIGVALITGAILIGVSYHAINSEALFQVDRLVKYNAEYETTFPVLTTWRIFQILFFVGLVVMIAGVVGTIGAINRNKCMVCTYVTVGGVLSFVMIIAAISALLRRDMVEPIVSKQVDDLCVPETYIRLSMNLPCSWAAMYNQTKPECGAIACQPKIERLKGLGENEGGGCWLLPNLCKTFDYTALDTAGCAAKLMTANGTWYKAGVGVASSDSACADECNEDIACTSYVFVEDPDLTASTCWLADGLPSKHKVPEWSPVAGAAAKVAIESAAGDKLCYDRSTPRVVEKFKTQGLRMALTTLALGIMLTASVALTFVLMYNVNVKRVGKPKGNDLALMLCCPCLAGSTHKRLNAALTEDEETAASASEDG